MPVDAAQTMRELRERLHRYPLPTHPVEHATIQFNLGLALSEAPDGDREKNLRSAIEAYARALNVFDENSFPVFRARVLTALGTVERELGMTDVAIGRFEEAAACLTGEDANAELGSANNNLGLALVDSGRYSQAVRAFDVALESFSSPEYTRQHATTLVNRGLALSSLDTTGGLEEAIADYEKALGLLDIEQVPYAYALAQHSRGVALMSLPERRQERLAEGVRSFQDALNVFTRAGYPFQHALTKHNLGLAFLELAAGDATNLRRALSSAEEAASLLDPRIHREQWLEMQAAVERVLQELASQGFEETRVEHFATLLGSVSAPERFELQRYRIGWLSSLREPHRSEAILAHDRAIVRLPPDQQSEVARTWIKVLMEQPHELLELGISTRQRAQAELRDDQLQSALQATEAALGELEVIQRVRVRDMLTELGYERPDST